MISLENFNINDILVKYGIIPDKNITKGSTKLDKDISVKPIDKSESKHTICMIDDLRNPMPQSTDLCCWYDTEPFDTKPLGIPIKCIRDKDIIEELSQLLNIKFGEIIFEGEGIFCSKECCKTYIIKNYTHLYRDALANLVVYDLLNGGTINNIECRGSVKSLKKFGGKLSIEQFRDNKGYKYIDINNIIKPYMFPIGNLLKEIK